MTEKLYYKDNSIIVFKAEIIEIECYSEYLLLVLDRTAFFPEGGGQPSDKGFINGIELIHVFEKNGYVYHKLPNTNVDFSVGQEIIGNVDYKNRFIMMQSHSGEHLVSGIAYNLFEAENVGFHIDENYVMTVDFDKKLSFEDISKIEIEANLCIYNDLPVEAYEVSSSEAEKLDFRSKLDFDGDFRLVEIADVDLCACCALHVNSTGEIGLIKILSCISHRGGVRITMICGETALKDYILKYNQIIKISSALCSKHDEAHLAVDALLITNSKLKSEVAQLKSKHLQYVADNIKEEERIIFSDNMPMDELRELVNLLGRKAELIAVTLSCSDNGQYSYCIYSEKLNLVKFSKDFNQRFHGNGGGRGNIIQGKVVADINDIINFIKDFKVTDYENA